LKETLGELQYEQEIAVTIIQELQKKLKQVATGYSYVDGANSHAALQQMQQQQYSSVDANKLAELDTALQQANEEKEQMNMRIGELEQELEESTNSGLEMHNMLQDLLHSQKDTAGFQQAVDSLQSMLDSQREKVETLTADLTIKNTMNEELKLEAVNSREKISKLEYQLEQVSERILIFSIVNSICTFDCCYNYVSIL